MTTRAAQATRGVVAALVATFIALFSHSVADGAPPSRVGLLLALAFAVPTCVALAGRRMSRIRLSISVVSSQFAFHAAMLLGNPDTNVARSGSAGTSLHRHENVPVLDLAGSVGHSEHDVTMWVAHALAAVATIIALRQGERAVWSILHRRAFESARSLFALAP